MSGPRKTSPHGKRTHRIEEETRTMLITGKYIPRRTFLRGAGVSLALPLLESMTPALSRAAATPKTRFVALFSPHGWAPTYWADNRKEGLENVKIEKPEERNAGLGF